MAYDGVNTMAEPNDFAERRVAARGEVALYGAELTPSDSASLFVPQSWAKSEKAGAGRGSAWFVSDGTEYFVLRQFRRGGALAKVLTDTYFFCGEDQTRSFAEFRLLANLWQSELPVPKPCAAYYQRTGLVYRAALLTHRIPESDSWARWLKRETISDALWVEVGQCIALFHFHGVDHADLNAHNILVDAHRKIWLIDFDKGQIRPAHTRGWQQKNLQRLLRSLHKLIGEQHGEAFVTQGWLQLQQAYTNHLERLKRQS